MAGPTPTWTPTQAVMERANLTALMRRLDIDDYARLHRWSIERRADFWQEVVRDLGLVFQRPPDAIATGEGNPETIEWLPGARFNIAENCFRHDPADLALVARFGGSIHRMTSGDLKRLVMRVVNGFRNAGYEPGHRIAIAMPMTLEAVAAYLGIVWAGGVVVAVADSFAPEEIAARLRIANCDTVLTQDRIVRGGKALPMYDKVVAAEAAHAIVVDTGGGRELRPGDVVWDDFLGTDALVPAVACRPDDVTNILFSSGTTGDPKAIPWTHLTPIKSAMDGRFHQDIHSDDLVAWPTNLGWMMGPWLIYASLLNGAALALYDDIPTGTGFLEFVAEAGVTVLGLVPSLVAAWRAADDLGTIDWSDVRVLSSTGEASNPADMAWLMNAAGAPMIDYCGGTELGGGYVAGTVIEPAVAAMFTTSTLGTDFVLLDEEGRRTSSGEVFLIPPAIGMSQRLLNRDHHDEYYAGTPSWGGHVLRRHGDHMEEIDGGYYQAHGRIDDTMNLGGIKVSSADIERVAGHVAGVAEVAAIALDPPGGGPSRLVIVAVPEGGAEVDTDAWHSAMQQEIRTHLNPLFKIHEVVARPSLPRTASAKVMRRALRTEHAADG